MKIVTNRFIPVKGYKAINIFGIVFVRRCVAIDSKTLNHEYIHTAQMKEMLWIFFYLWYFVEWLIRLFGRGNAYRSISLEREAHEFDNYKLYLTTREPFEWLHYVFNKNVYK